MGRRHQYLWAYSVSMSESHWWKMDKLPLTATDNIVRWYWIPSKVLQICLTGTADDLYRENKFLQLETIWIPSNVIYNFNLALYSFTNLLLRKQSEKRFELRSAVVAWTDWIFDVATVWHQGVWSIMADIPQIKINKTNVVNFGEKILQNFSHTPCTVRPHF